MTNDERVDIKITRTGKRKESGIVEDILARNTPFPSDECMFEEDSHRSFENSLKKNPVTLWKDEDEHDDIDVRNPESDLTYSQTLKPLLRDMKGALEQRGQLRIRRYDRGDEIVWVVQIDPHRAKFLDRIFMDFVTFLKRTFNAE